MPVLSLTLSTDIDAVLAEARRNSLTRDNPLLSDLPDWFTEFRNHQRVAIREILTAYEEGVECVVLDAPTGSGKTVVGETVRRLCCGVGRQGQTTYICSSKALQDQFVRDYPYAKVLKGRSNYATVSYPERFGGKDGLSCADCTKTPGDSESCLWCPEVSGCTYERAKADALRSSLAVLNTSYYLSECNGPGRFSRGGFVIADEADVLESELMGHVEVRISERRLKTYGLGVPKYVTKEESWREWAEEAHEVVRSHRPKLGMDIQAIREQKRHALLLQKLRSLKEGLEAGNYIYTGDRNHVAFKPVTVDFLGQDKFWRHGDRFLLMSATVISADEMLESLGWDEEKSWRLVKVPSTFPPENRKVVVWPVANVTRKTKEEAYPKLAEGVKTVLAKHPDDRTLVHSTSYELTRMLVEALVGSRFGSPGGIRNRRVFSYSSSAEKDAALSAFLATPTSILVSPSMERGVDLPGDACRVQIICKVPFKAMDRQVTARLYSKGGSIWYAVDAIRTLVQMCGRGVRSEGDWCRTYVLDKQVVDNIWGNYRRLIPEWFKAAVEFRKAI